MRSGLKTGARAALSLLAAMALWGCASGPEVRAVDAGPPLSLHGGDDVRIALVGDTGEPGPELEALLETLAEEPKDLVVVLGDLVYPEAPRCPAGDLTPEARRILDERVGAALGGLGAPVLLVLGNHDVAGARRDRAREACLLAYAEEHPNLVMPALAYTVDVGPGVAALVHTNALSDAQAAMVKRAFAGEDGWRLLFGHHVLQTYADKRREDWVRPWLEEHRIAPHLYANGHSHLLQFGVYGGVPAVTSGASARLRVRASCPPDCGPGQLWGASERGYTLLVLTRERLRVSFKDAAGAELFAWSRGREELADEPRRAPPGTFD